jgi:integrase
MASIERRSDGTYRARWREHPGGPQRARHFQRKLDAEHFLDRLRGDLVRGLYVDPAASRVRFGDYAQAWRVSQVHRPTTAALVESHLRNHVLPFFELRPIGSIRPSDIQSWARERSGVLAPPTIKVVHRYLSAIFRAAMRDRIISANPCEGIRLPAVVRQEVEPLETASVLRLSAAVPTRFRALVILAAASGLRQGEAFGLELRHVDFQRAAIRVEQQLITLGSQTSIGPPKTPASVRTIPVPNTVLHEVEHHLTSFGLRDRDLSRLIFTTEGGDPIRRNRFGEIWRRAVTQAGLPAGTGFHALRHYYASLLIRHGESVKVVQVRLGHASAAETLDTYSHLWPDAADRTRQAVDRALGRELKHAKAMERTPRQPIHRSIEPPGLSIR